LYLDFIKLIIISVFYIDSIFSLAQSLTKSNAMRRKHHELEKALRNRERNDDDYSNDTFNEHTESISSCDVIKESDEREEK